MELKFGAKYIVLRKNILVSGDVVVCMPRPLSSDCRDYPKKSKHGKEERRASCRWIYGEIFTSFLVAFLNISR